MGASASCRSARPRARDFPPLTEEIDLRDIFRHLSRGALAVVALRPKHGAWVYTFSSFRPCLCWALMMIFAGPMAIPAVTSMVTMVPFPQSRMRPSISMCWVDRQQMPAVPERWQGKNHVTADEGGAATLGPEATRARVSLRPHPKFEPHEVVEYVLEALQRGGDLDIEDVCSAQSTLPPLVRACHAADDCSADPAPLVPGARRTQAWQFVVPDGELASDHWSSAGSMNKFRWRIRMEPRWRNIARRPCAALLRMRSWQILGSIPTHADVRLMRIRAEPYFPDAPAAESEAVFLIQTVRQRADEHPSAHEVLGELADCWLINAIKPDFGAWKVKDPLGAGRAPDHFTPPKRL